MLLGEVVGISKRNIFAGITPKIQTDMLFLQPYQYMRRHPKNQDLYHC